ncbi:unnamed protein product [Arctogadus glacialis]
MVSREDLSLSGPPAPQPQPSYESPPPKYGRRTGRARGNRLTDVERLFAVHGYSGVQPQQSVQPQAAASLERECGNIGPLNTI